MTLRSFLFLLILLIGSAQFALAQTAPPPPARMTPEPTPLPRISETLAKNLASLAPNQEISRDKREQAYVKLLEGQRYNWSAGRLRSQAGIATTSRLAKQAFQKAVELDPTLAEGYTALAELAISILPGDLEEAISLATIATKIEPDNFGGRRILARLYTYKSGLTSGKLDQVFADKAILEWKQVTRLDPRNAEGWAFLSEFYEKANRQAERIEALKKWLGSAAPIETQFYQRLMGRQESLAPEAASLKLGPALLKAGRTQEAIETLSIVIADDPDNAEAIDLLREAIESSGGEDAGVAIQALQQAVFANPGNRALVILLAHIMARAGKLDDAVKVLRASTEKLAGSDRIGAASLLISLGDLYNGSDRNTEAVAAYEEALVLRGLDKASTVGDDEREFAMQVFDKMIQSLKSANRPAEVRTVIERARRLLGKNDLFADRQLISFYRESGKRADALAAVRAVRLRMPQDYGFVRLEATLLTESGKVDEAVVLIKKLMDSKSAGTPVTGSANENGTSSVSVALPAQDEFSNYLFISNLYSQASRSREAVDAANRAFAVARGAERKQIAKLTLATAQQMGGDFKAAETTLRDILKETPGNPIALNNLGYFLLERDERLSEALDLILEALKVDPTNPSYIDSLGWAYFKLGKFAEAEKYLKDAARIDTGSATIQEHLGDVYQKQGKAGPAKIAWEKALNLASDPTDIMRLKGKLKP